MIKHNASFTGCFLVHKNSLAYLLNPNKFVLLLTDNFTNTATLAFKYGF